MTDSPGKRPRRSGDAHLELVFVPEPELPLRRKSFWRRHSRGSFVGALLLAVAIGAGFVYAFRIEAAREREVSHATP